jgi:uncharacterized protein YjbI with pentapeptide repeats
MSNKLSREEALKKIEELKKYVESEDKKESSKTKLLIKNLADEILWESEKTTIKEALEEAVEDSANLWGANLWDANLRDANLGDANLWDADLRDADLRGANLRGANFYHTKFYGKGGKTKINRDQVDDFLKALGVVVEG